MTIDLVRLAAHPCAAVHGLRFVHLHEAPSTQDVVRAAASAGEPAGLVVIADHQTAGRGQFGRSWQDIAGDTLLCSILLRPSDMQPAQTPTLVLGFAEALVEVLNAAGPVASIRVKYPNDVVVDRDTGTCKLAGFLAEGVANARGQQWVVLGFGININKNPDAVVDGVHLQTTSAAVNAVVRQPFTRTSILGDLLAAVATKHRFWR